MQVPGRPKAGKPYQPDSPIIATSRYNQSAISLFRFSALTFNGTCINLTLLEDLLNNNCLLAHQIHYSLPWTQRVEGHPDIVVHAPLNLILMLELYRKSHPDTTPTSIEYRAVSPLYAGDAYSINLSQSGEVWCGRDQDQGVCLTGRIS